VNEVFAATTEIALSQRGFVPGEGGEHGTTL
jgi:hypothetical protein